MSDLRNKIIKLAFDNPEFREDLLPLVKQAADTFKCPNCGTKVLKQTGYCVKCEKKVKESATKTAGIDVAELLMPDAYDALYKLKLDQGTQEMFLAVYDELNERLGVDRQTEEALGRFLNVLKGHTKRPDDIRNQLGKAMNILGLKTPLMF